MDVAIKKLTDVFSCKEHAASILREITILKKLPPHPNIVTLCDVFEPSNDPFYFKSIFIVFRRGGTDLQKLIRSDKAL